MKKVLTLLVLVSLLSCSNMKNNKDADQNADSTEMVTDSVVAQQTPQQTFTEDQILTMAANYTKAPNFEIDTIENGLLLVHCFEMVQNGDDDGHNATYDWLTIDPKTGKGTNFMEEEVDFTKYLNK